MPARYDSGDDSDDTIADTGVGATLRSDRCDGSTTTAKELMEDDELTEDDGRSGGEIAGLSAVW